MSATVNAEQRRQFRLQLKQRYRELWDDVQRELAAAEPYQQIAGETHDAEDEATADVLVDTRLAEVHRDIGEMRDIQAALRRLTGESYGSCPDCGADIAIERLRLNPAVVRCHDCQQRYEKHHLRTAGATL
jgi:RNA polymerase-binding protein DksA